MKAFVFKPSNALIGKFDISSIDQIPDAIVKFGESHTLSPYDYIECVGKIWTLVDGSQGLELAEGRKHGSSITNSGGNSIQEGQQGDVTSRYKDAYLTASAISGIGGVIKILGIVFGVGLLFLGFIAASQLGREIGTVVVISNMIVGILGGTILYVK
jgi:hypothetical protein